MTKLKVMLVLAAVACAAPALAADVAVSIAVGEPGFYGRLDIGDVDRPMLVNTRPVIIVERSRGLAPVYLRVPPGHQRDWSKHCARYDACARPVYFVRDEWYLDVYAPGYRKAHGHDKNGKGKGKGNGKKNGDRN